MRRGMRGNIENNNERSMRRNRRRRRRSVTSKYSLDVKSNVRPRTPFTPI